MSRSGFVLIVEDDAPGSCAALIASLAQRGYSSTTVGTLAIADLVVETVIPDVIVLDLGLPDGNGEALLGRLRASAEPRLSRVPVVVVSGQPDARERAKDADAFLPKPIRLERLLSVIEDLKP